MQVVTVYYWPARGDNIGHVAMMVTGGMPAGPVYISWWPNGSGIKELFVKGALGSAISSLTEDIKLEGFLPLFLVVPGLDESKIKARWSDWKKGDYRALDKNCANTVAAALYAGDTREKAEG